MYLFKVEILKIKKQNLRNWFFWRIQMYEDRIIHGIRKTKELIALNKLFNNINFSIANMAFMALLAADVGVHPDQYRQWARSQIGYALGDTGRSFVVGFGTNPPQRPHHRSRYNKLIIWLRCQVQTTHICSINWCKVMQISALWLSKIDVLLCIITCNLGKNIFKYLLIYL